MGWSVSEHSQPDRKILLGEKRLGRLRGAIMAGESADHIANAAEKVRLAALALTKAKRALIREYPRRDPDGRIAASLLEEELRWRSLSLEALAEDYGRAAL